MTFNDRCYWFFRNLLAFLLFVFCFPIYIIIDFLKVAKILFNTSGSEIITFPWEK